jgi:hypothetical protein
VARGPVVAVVTVAAFGGALMTFQPVMQAYMMDWFEGASESGAFGMARLVYAIIASAGSTVVGVAAGCWATIRCSRGSPSAWPSPPSR